MSQLGHSRHIRDVRAMSASLPTPDILLSRSKRRSGPQTDIAQSRPPVNERAGDPNIAFGVGKFAGLTGVIGAFSTHDAIAGTTPHEAGAKVPSIARGCLVAYSLKFF
jgi:hypothetical protein